MLKSYLVIDRGLSGERTYHLRFRLTIGRAPENDIHLLDPSVSRLHPLAYIKDEKVILENMGSCNGTHVNEELFKKAILTNSDIVRIGNVTVQLLKVEGIRRPAHMNETQEITRCADTSDNSLQLSRRRLESVSNIFLFSSLDRKDLDKICKSAIQEDPIIRHGEWGDSLFIILDGRMRVFIYGNQGKKVTLQLLGENHFFGESSSLIGKPHTTSVEALEDSLLCKLSFETIRDLAEKHPVIKVFLEQSHHDLLNRIERRREFLGIEGRKHLRHEILLKVILTVSPDLSSSDRFQIRIFQGISIDISLSSIKVRFKEKSLQLPAMGCDVRLEIVLPSPFQSIRCIGIVRHMMETYEGDYRMHMEIEFSDMISTTQRMLEHFLYSWGTAQG